MTRAETILQHLQKIRRTKPNSYLACGPAHADRSPSLSISELADGRVLLHCFAGCSVHEVVSAIGLSLEDLFPPNEDGKHFAKGERRPISAADCLRVISFEASLVAIAAADLAAGKPLAEGDKARLTKAVVYIDAALAAGGIA